jgi:NTE family protein
MQHSRLASLTKKTPTIPLSLALQGGGTLGAFTCGALQQVLARPDFDIRAVSGTSAGALNGAILISGLANGGRRYAASRLRSFWTDVANMGEIAQLPARFARAVQPLAPNTPLPQVSPYHFNPLNLNPLRTLVERYVDPCAFGGPDRARLFVTATHVGSGLPRIFADREITIDVLMASCCLPQMFHTVEIEGEGYWDGAFVGNPTIWPLIHFGGTTDVVLVQLVDTRGAIVPRDMNAIRRRCAEIAFNAPLVAELQAIHAMRRMTEGSSGGHALGTLRWHRIGPPRSRGNPLAQRNDRPSVARLQRSGAGAASRFLRTHGSALGQRSTLDWKQYVLHAKPRVSVRQS